jgi:hypothetical protein
MNKKPLLTNKMLKETRSRGRPALSHPRQQYRPMANTSAAFQIVMGIETASFDLFILSLAKNGAFCLVEPLRLPYKNRDSQWNRAREAPIDRQSMAMHRAISVHLE